MTPFTQKNLVIRETVKSSPRRADVLLFAKPDFFILHRAVLFASCPVWSLARRVLRPRPTLARQKPRVGKEEDMPQSRSFVSIPVLVSPSQG